MVFPLAKWLDVDLDYPEDLSENLFELNDDKTCSLGPVPIEDPVHTAQEVSENRGKILFLFCSRYTLQ